MDAQDFAGAKVIPVSGTGTEDVAVDDQGRMYTGLEDGRILRVSPDGALIETIGEVSGRPLGVELYGDEDLVVCVADVGLVAMSIATGKHRVLADKAFDAPIVLCNNAAVAADGSVYFSESSRRFQLSHWRHDIVEQTMTGRLLRLNTDGTVDELLGGLHFANGVALAADESYVTVAESGACTVQRLWLTGPKAGKSELFANLSSYPDNSCTGSDGLIWVAIPAPRNPALGVVQRLPKLGRSLVLRLPEALQPQPARVVKVVALNDDGAEVHAYEGEIDGFHMLTGVRERDGKLYLGSLYDSCIAVLDR